MSTPQNELSKYRSYSYYHVLAICDSSDTAVELSAATSLDVWQHSNASDSTQDGVNVRGKYSKKTLPSSEGNYVILINGATDASFSITSAKWTTATAASATMDDRNTSIAVEGNIQISEPKGVIFLDQIVNSCLDLGVDTANAFWVLKTFFVGYTFTPEEGEGVEHITTIPPIIFIAYDVVGTFELTGGLYDISFVAAANGASRLPHYSKMGKAVNMNSAGSFADTLTKFAQEINNNYDHYFNCVKSSVSRVDGGAELADNFRRVKYVIEAAEVYQNPYYQCTDAPLQLKNIADCPAPAPVHVDAGIGIEDGIHKIINLCPQIKAEANEGINGEKYIAKIHTWVTSSRATPGSSELVYTVGYRVIRQQDPHTLTFEKYNTPQDVADNAVTDDNVIVFDYLYTGKNIDILEFDIKMNMGMVFLQGMTIANPYKQPNQHIPVVGSAVSQQGLNSRWNGKNIPIFFGTNIKTAGIRGSQDISQSAQNAYNMTKHASLEMLEASVKITGNSQLLGSINNTTNPDVIAKQLNTDAPQDGFARYSNWALTPSFAKINIKMPRNNDDLSLFTGTQTSSDVVTSNDYAVDFWFNGYYFIYQIDHVFDQGEFYQILGALGIPEKDSFKTEESTTNQRDVVLAARVENCYEHWIDCGQDISGETGSTAVGAPISSIGTPVT